MKPINEKQRRLEMLHRKYSFRCRNERGGAKYTSENNIQIRGWWHCTSREDGTVHNAVRGNFNENMGDDETRNTRPSSEPEL